jgi:hypothetical protein
MRLFTALTLFSQLPVLLMRSGKPVLLAKGLKKEERRPGKMPVAKS